VIDLDQVFGTSQGGQASTFGMSWSVRLRLWKPARAPTLSLSLRANGARIGLCGQRSRVESSGDVLALDSYWSVTSKQLPTEVRFL
jgi:hypothetical protein